MEHEPLIVPELRLAILWQEVEDTDPSGHRRIGRGYRVAFTVGHEAMDRPVLVLPVNGSQRFHRTALQEPAFAPGKLLVLRPEPGNPYDPDAVAVWDAGERHHVGYVPAEQSKSIAEGMRAGSSYEARVVWEWLTLDGERTHIRMIVSRSQEGHGV